MNLTSVLLNRNKCMKYFLSLVDCIHAEGFGFIHMGFYLYTDKKGKWNFIACLHYKQHDLVVCAYSAVSPYGRVTLSS